MASQRRVRLVLRLAVLGLPALGLSALVSATGVFADNSEPVSAPASDSAKSAPSERDRAIEQVLTSARSGDPFLRADAIEAAMNLPDRIVPLVQLGLDDPHPAVRFNALVTIGKLHLAAVAPAAQRLLEDPSESVRAAAIYALRSCGRKADATPMAAMLTRQDLGLRANVAMLLGLMGDASAAPMLKDMAAGRVEKASHGAEAVERIQIAEALVKLGDPDALNVVRAACYSQYDEVRVLAVQILGRAGDRGMEGGLAVMLDKPPLELQLAAAEALARLGHNDGLPVVLDSASSELPTVRAQAAMVLPLFSDKRAGEALEKLLDDPQEPVRLAAAAGLLGQESTLAGKAAAALGQ